MLDINKTKALLDKHNTSFYVFEEEEFKKNYLDLLNTFRSIYKNYNIAYSYKTNYTPYICNCVKKLGGLAEVVSDMEYYLAKKLGYDNSNIIYNGPVKGDKLEEHIINGGISNIDNIDEAKRIVNIAKKNIDKKIKVGIRVNSDVGAGYISRFGLELDSKEFIDTIELLKTSSNIKLVGFHCHVSRARGLDSWKKRIDNLLYSADKYIDGTPEFIDVGSGMFGKMDPFFSAQFGDNVPSYLDYAKVVAGTMEEHYKDSINKPLLLSEPGTTIISNYISLVTKVVQKKKIKDKTFVTVDSSFYNAGDVCLVKQLPYYVLDKSKNLKKNICDDNNISVMGYTCLEQDCLAKNFNINLEISDVIVFGNVGGYSIVSKPPFIQPNIPLYVIDSENKEIEIKRKETFEDIYKTFKYEGK